MGGQYYMHPTKNETTDILLCDTGAAFNLFDLSQNAKISKGIIFFILPSDSFGALFSSNSRLKIDRRQVIR